MTDHQHHHQPVQPKRPDQGADHQGHHAHMAEEFRARFWVALALTLPVVALAPMIQEAVGLRQALVFPGDRWLQFAAATAVFLYGGWPFLTGLGQEWRQRQPGMMTLIALAISVAFGYSAVVVLGVPGKTFFWETATLIDVMLLGHWLEMRSVLGASRALERLAALLPKEAHRLTADGAVEDVPVSTLRSGDRVMIKPGERIPTDGVIVEGRTSVNEAMLTGESAPVEKAPDDPVIGGAVNGEAAITMAVGRIGEETYLSQVLATVRQAQETRSRTQDLADRAAGWLTYVALAAGAITLVAWLAAGQAFVFALERAVTVMVITCPHALGLAIPLVVAVSTAQSAAQGLLVRDRSAFERSKDLDAVIFDKTGTLTEGRFAVEAVVPLGDRTEEEVLALAAAVEGSSEHPIAAGIVRSADDRKLDRPAVSDFRAIPGKGAQATVNGATVRVVSPGWLAEHNLAVPEEGVATLARQGYTVVYVVGGEDELLGAVALGDVVRDSSRAAVDQLKALGMRVLMLTGDAEPVARRVAEELGLDEHFAQVLPDQKADRVKEVQRRGLRVAMVGDGVNDAPALATADVGIAIGAGTDIAIESADIVLVKSDPRHVLALVRLARATYRKMVQNLWWATGYNIVAIPLAAGALASVGILLSPAVGAALMSLSTVIVAINARMLRT